MKNQWYAGMFQDDSNDEDQDTIKVSRERKTKYLYKYNYLTKILVSFKKRTLLDTNPYLLLLTVAITLVHNVFEFLAFKNGKKCLNLKMIIMLNPRRVLPWEIS